MFEFLAPQCQRHSIKGTSISGFLPPIFSINLPTLLEKQSKFLQYNMKCRRKHDTTCTWNIPRSITFSRYFSFGTVYQGLWCWSIFEYEFDFTANIWIKLSNFLLDIRILKNLSSMHHTAESSSTVCMHPTAESSSTVCITLRSQVIKIFCKNSSVCIPPRSQAPWCASYCWVWLRSLMHTTESLNYQVSVLIRSFKNAISLWCLKILKWK